MKKTKYRNLYWGIRIVVGSDIAEERMTNIMENFIEQICEREAIKRTKTGFWIERYKEFIDENSKIEKNLLEKNHGKNLY